MTTIGTMKVLDIQEKEGYSLVTFEIPDDCKQFLIEHAIRDLLTKAAKEAEEKYGSALPEPEQTVDNQTSLVYNEDRDGWIPNTGVRPDGELLVDVLFADGEECFAQSSTTLWWGLGDKDASITHWRLSKQDK